MLETSSDRVKARTLQMWLRYADDEIRRHAATSRRSRRYLLIRAAARLATFAGIVAGTTAGIFGFVWLAAILGMAIVH